MAAKEKIGIVVSDKMKDTRIVAVNDRIIHKDIKKLLQEQNVMLFMIKIVFLQLVIKFVFVKRNQLVKLKIGSLIVF